jgi:HEPN domain-containing protein
VTGEEGLPPFDVVLSRRPDGGYDVSLAFCDDAALRSPAAEALQAEAAEAARGLVEGLLKLGADGRRLLADASRMVRFAAAFGERVVLRTEDANRHLRGKRYPEAILAVQEALELNAKVIFLATIGEYPKNHIIDERKFGGQIRKVLDHTPPTVDEERVVRALFVARFWGAFYTMAKYGMEGLQISPSRLFGKDEARLALAHLSEVLDSGAHLLEQKFATVLPEREEALCQRLFGLGLRQLRVSEERHQHGGRDER